MVCLAGVVRPTLGAGCDVTALAAGTRHNLALRSDGTVLAWGENTFGQLGDGTTVDSDTPVQVKTAGGVDLTDVVAVAAGGWHSVALKGDGSVWAWGSDAFRQLGPGFPGPDPFSTEAVQVRVSAAGNPLMGVIAIAAGSHHSLALINSGLVAAWGNNDAGQLGNNAAGAPPASLVSVQWRTRSRGSRPWTTWLESPPATTTRSPCAATARSGRGGTTLAASSATARGSCGWWRCRRARSTA